MAKRSDFAQKLLDDLRLRKERNTASQSQRTTQSNQLPIDAYAYSKQTYRGSGNAKAIEAVTSRTGDTLTRPSSRSHRTSNNGKASDQIVVYGRGQSSVQLSDISLALAYAFDNGGKLRRDDSSLTSSMMGFLHQIKRGTMEYSKIGRGSNLDRQLATANHFPTSSPGQINEISKGVQKLNQILRACSNGDLNMDRYSIEFAKELLRGAMDLEESLRMLVDLQKSSDSMKNSQKKNRITFIEDDNDDDDDDDRTTMTSEQRQLAPPRFSFDESSRNSHKLQEVGNSALTQRPLVLTYSKERRNLSNEKQDVNVSKLLPHRQSTSSISDDKNINALSEQKNQSASMKSNTEKARIPNVIAKLMGLDNIPEKVESGNPSQKDSGSPHKIERTTFKHSAKKNELKSRKTENLVPPKQQKGIEPVIVPKTQEKELLYGADENLIIQKASSEVAVKNGKMIWRELHEIKASNGAIKVEKQHNNSYKMTLNRESGKDVHANGRKQVQATNREQKVALKGRTNDLLLNNMLAQLERGHERSEVDSSLQEEKEDIGIFLQPVKKNMNKKEATNQKKSQNHSGIQKPYALLKYGPQEEQHHREKQLQHREKHMLELRIQKGSEAALKNSSKLSHDLANSLKKQTLTSQATPFKHTSAENVDVMKQEVFLVHDHNDLNQDEASNEFNVKVEQVNNRKPGQITSPRNQQSEPFTGKHGFTTMMDQTSVHKLANEKVKNIRKKKADSTEKIEEVLTRRNGTMVHSTAKVKQGSPNLKEMRRTPSESDKFNLSKEAKQERASVLKEADARIISSNDSVSIIEPLNVRQQPHPKAELSPTLYNSYGEKVQGEQELLDLVPNNSYRNVKSVDANDKQHLATPLAVDEKFESCEIAPTTINGVHEESIDINYHSQKQVQRISKKGMQEPLSESENCLKWILVTSQPFLNTAEALFKLNIPFSILRGCGVVDNQDEGGSKLILDCSYEVTKRKGIRQELKVHPCLKASISPIKIGSLDDLVRQLNEDMEKLKFYGRNRTSPVHVEDYLPTMLENDVYNKYPDMNCMWDLGWNQETFAFLEKYDVTRVVEKHILNGLLDEITRELSNVRGGPH
ncbi:uncharacterized protein LOC114760449 [Neltuma alba]|uniref:uncharacterized protein LOC114741701 n=1 Tax=Neltuma alba TaxID=207710 RepID=UPI0010A4CBB5|nr:uncharacterized protein LOC114741701 [Prosopis alba]XP_028805538.1 uncharacterized protein LOC114760449 [Prosopis alba]